DPPLRRRHPLHLGDRRADPALPHDPAGRLQGARHLEDHARALLVPQRSPVVDRYDVIILGGGLIGSSTAMHLAERGVKSVCVLDVDLNGRYSSSELNAGGVRATWRSELNVELSLASIGFFETVRAEVGFDQKGYLWLYDAARWDKALAAREWQNQRF